MPELPEVEAARKALHENCCGRRILQANIAEDPIVIHGVTSSALESALTGRTILAAFRKGKNLWLQLDARPWPSFQFGMTGAFNIKGKEITKYKRSAVSDKEEWPSKFSKVFLKLDDGVEISFTDKRRLARVRLLDDPVSAPPISELGPDAFLELPIEATFTSSVLKKKCPIKALLLDQSFLAGIGNWLADEVLYQARVHPEQMASSLSEAQCIELHKTIREVLNFSVEVDADSEYFPEDWIFHYRWNKKPGEVGGQKISFITVGGRTSAIVPALQKCTMQSTRKKKDATQQQEEDLENGTITGKKMKGRKSRAVASAEAVESHMPVDVPVEREPKGARKKGTPSRSKKSKKLSRKSEAVANEEEREVDVRDKKAFQSSETRTQKVTKAAASVKPARKQGRTPAKKLEEASEEAVTDTVVVAQNQKVGKTALSQKATKKSEENSRQEKLVEAGNIPKKTQGQKRKRVAK